MSDSYRNRVVYRYITLPEPLNPGWRRTGVNRARKPRPAEGAGHDQSPARTPAPGVAGPDPHPRSSGSAGDTRPAGGGTAPADRLARLDTVRGDRHDDPRLLPGVHGPGGDLQH